MKELATAEWSGGLVVDKKGNITKTPANASLLLTHSPEWRGVLQWDILREVCVWSRPPPRIPGLDVPHGIVDLDTDVVYIQAALNHKFGVEFAHYAMVNAVKLAAKQNSFNGMQKHLLDLEWDKKPRLKTWLHDYLGAPNTEYESQVGRMWLIGAAARALRPGCKNDYVLVLEGRQGTGKSTCARMLGGDYYLSKLPNLREYERAAHAIGGKSIVEIGELDAFRGAAMTQIKDFLTLEHDHFRAPFQREPKTRARTCSFLATTNDAVYLRDVSGARRFWPVRIVQLLFKEFARDRDQLWAEAVRAFENGESWHPSSEMIPMFEEEQEKRQEVDAWESIVADFLEAADDSVTLTSAIILQKAIGLSKDKWGIGEQARVGMIMRRLGYRRKRARVGKLREYQYVKDSTHNDGVSTHQREE